MEGAVRTESLPKPFPAVPLADLSIAARPESVQGLFGPGTVSAILGPPNFGKSFLAVNLGLHVAAGATWHTRKVRRSPVLYIGAEAPGSVAVRARVAADRQFPGKTLPFYLVSVAPLLGDDDVASEAAEQVIATARWVESQEGEPVGVILLDTVAASMGNGEENSRGMMRLAQSVRRIAEELQLAVVLLHHPGKQDATALRGHSSLAGACDTIIAVELDDLTGVRTVTVVKARDAATGQQFSFTLDVIPVPEPDSFGDPRTVCIVQPTATAKVRRRPGGKAQDQLLQELERRYRAGETIWSVATIRVAGKGIGLHRNSIPKAMSGLERAGFLRGPPEGMTLTDPPGVSA
jgi:AAA domain